MFVDPVRPKSTRALALPDTCGEVVIPRVGTVGGKGASGHLARFAFTPMQSSQPWSSPTPAVAGSAAAQSASCGTSREAHPPSANPAARSPTCDRSPCLPNPVSASASASLPPRSYHLGDDNEQHDINETQPARDEAAHHAHRPKQVRDVQLEAFVSGRPPVTTA